MDDRQLFGFSPLLHGEGKIFSFQKFSNCANKSRNKSIFIAKTYYSLRNHPLYLLFIFNYLSSCYVKDFYNHLWTIAKFWAKLDSHFRQE